MSIQKTSVPNPRASLIHQVLPALVSLTLAMTLGGCRSSGTMDTADLPTQWLSREVTAPGTIDLSTMARQATSTDLIYPGDVLEITMATGAEEQSPQTWPLRVMEDGQVQVPLVGSVRLAGLSLTDAEQQVRRLSVQREIFRDPHVSVLMKQRRMIQVRVVGAVETPGVYELPAAGSDLLAALVAAGGFNDEAGSVIEIRHPNSASSIAEGGSAFGVRLASFVESTESPARTVHVDLTANPSEASELDLHLEDGSVVVVQERTKRSVSVIGLVQRPNNYELPTDESLRVLDAIALAGGLRVSVANQVRVIRRIPEREDPIVIEVSLRKAKLDGRENLVLTAGDIVSVEETPATFLVETIRGFLRFGFTSAIPGI